MPDRPSRDPAYRHYKPKNLAVVRIDGKDHYLGRYDSPESREKYHRLLAERSAAGKVPTPAEVNLARAAEPGPLTVNELILAFWTYAEGYYRRADGTPTGELEQYRYPLRTLRTLFGSTPAHDFGPKRLKLVRQSMIDAGLCRKVVNRRIQRIVHLFAYGVESELLPGELHYRLKAVKPLRKGRSGTRETAPVRPAPDDLVEATKPFLTRQIQAMIDLQRLTGMRSGEVTIMRTCDIDTSGPVWSYVPERHKGTHLDKPRVILFGPRAQAVLAPWLRPNREEYLFQPREAMAEFRAERRRNRRSPMTPSQRARRPQAKPKRPPGERYDSRAYAHAVKRGCALAFPHPELSKVKAKELTPVQRATLMEWHRSHSWHPHQLRHGVATRLDREFDAEVARTVLGHSSPATTQIYIERDMGRAREAMREVG